MTKHSLFIRTIIIIWAIVLFRLCLPPYVLWDNILEFWSSFIDFKFTFSFSHFLILTASCIFLYFIRNWIYDHDKKVQLNDMARYINTLKDHDSFFVKLFLVVFPLSIVFFTVSAIYKFTQIPEILFLIILFTIIGFFEFKKDPKATDNFEKKPYLFTDEPIDKYSKLNDFQKIEVNQLKSILDAGLDEYLSIALNGSWGSGKTSILNGLKDLLENGYPESDNFESKYEVFELNLWQARTPENAIDELDRLFTELFNKVYLNVSSNDLAFFSLLSGSENSWITTTFKTLLGDNDPMPTSQKRLNYKLEKVLNRLKKQKLVILIDDLDRLPEQYLNGFLKIICYVTGLKNIVTISGVNKEKILLQLHTPEDIIIKADGVDPYKKSITERRIKDAQMKGNTPPLIKSEKEEYKFSQFDNESILSKIFSVQLELITSDYDMKSFVIRNKEKIEIFKSKILFEDKEDIITVMNNFIDRNSRFFNNIRDIKLFLYEVFIYLISFGQEKQAQIKISEYVEINCILTMAWAKIIYPDFYKKIMEYVVPFIYRKQNIRDLEAWRDTYKFKDFIKDQYQLNDNGLEQIVNTRAHRKIKTLFDQLIGNNNLSNPDAAIRYFHPIIEPYEIINGEFKNLFIESPTTNTIHEFILNKWNLYPIFVFNDFIRRVKLREFRLSERLNTTLALMDLVLGIDTNVKKINSETNINLWMQIISLLEYGTSSDKFKDANQLILQAEFVSKLLDLWEKKYKFIKNQDLNSSYEHLYQLNLFYRFFIVSNYEEDTAVETSENLKFILDTIALQKFKNMGNKIACLLFPYALLGEYWDGRMFHPQLTSKINEIIPVYLKSFFSNIDTSIKLPKSIIKDCLLLFDGLKSSCDSILFDSENLGKLIYLFKNKLLDMLMFIDAMGARHDGTDLALEQAENAREKLLAYIESESDYYGKGYEETIEKFFKPKVTENEISES